jgi:hypothetical protein
VLARVVLIRYRRPNHLNCWKFTIYSQGPSVRFDRAERAMSLYKLSSFFKKGKRYPNRVSVYKYTKCGWLSVEAMGKKQRGLCVFICALIYAPHKIGK